MSAKPSPRKRRSVRSLDDFPGLFDSVDIDMTTEKTSAPAAAPVEAPHESAEAPTQDVEINPSSLKRRDTVRFISFGSGSSGNCAYIGCREGGLLIDAGVDNKTVMDRLAANSIDPKTIAGILLTHDHSDHVRYAYSLLRANRNWALFCTPRTLSGVLRRHSISRRIKDYHKPIYKEFEFEAGGFSVTAFETSHDGTDNSGFSIVRRDHRFVVATDMGMITERAAHYMGLARYLMIEANYDAEMLRLGRYPEYLKARIAGATGHLDNVVTAEFVAGLCGEGRETRPSHVFLCHLSEDNNTPEMAVSAVRRALEAAGLTVGDASGSAVAKAAHIQLTALPRFDASPLYVLRGI